MRIDVTHRPAFAQATVHLDPDEVVVAEAGSMVHMDAHIAIETTIGNKDQSLLGGLFSGMKRMLAGESLFQNKYSSAGQPGKVTFAPSLPGDIAVLELTGNTLMMQSSAFLCSSPGVTLDAKWGGAKTFFGGEGMVMLKASGQGPVAFSSFGGIREVQVDGKFTVDTGNLVAFEDTLKFSVGRFGGGWAAFLFGGEGLVCNFTGTGKLWIQTRTPQGFGEALTKLLPPRQG